MSQQNFISQLSSKVISTMWLLFFSTAVFAMTDSDLKGAYAKSLNYENLGKYSSAINVLISVYNTYPTDYTINLRLGHLYYLNANYTNANNLYLEAQRLAPKALSPQLGLMKISNTREEFEKTEMAGYKILRVDNYNYYGNLYLTYALRKSKKFQAAATINNKMLSLYPEDTVFLLEYGLLHFATGENDQAKRALEYLLTLEPENFSAKEVINLIGKKLS